MFPAVGASPPRQPGFINRFTIVLALVYSERPRVILEAGHLCRYNGHMNAENFLRGLTGAGFDFFTGVPCSYLGPLLLALQGRPADEHLPAPREDLAAGLAAGAWLGGRLPVVYMQNSGLGYSLEAFASLHMIYRLPVLLLVSWRGPDDPGWEEHQVMGRHTRALLDTFGIPRFTWQRGRRLVNFARLARKVNQVQGPVVLLMGRGVFE